MQAIFKAHVLPTDKNPLYYTSVKIASAAHRP
jgi:hypothetical protein